MTVHSSWKERAARGTRAVTRPVTLFLKDAGNGLLEVSHNSLALLGLAVVAVAVFFAGRADLRHTVEQQAFGWLQARHEARVESNPTTENLAMVLAERDAITRATAALPTDLDRQQAAVAKWLSRRYRVAPEPVSRLVQEAWSVGQRAQLDPTLILAIMAIESSFNPFAQSSVGAQGLMQVMTRVHDDKYEAFGGTLAAFDPVTNLRVGVQVLKECIARAGSLEGGLRYYVGAANLTTDGGYAGKVLGEQAHLLKVAAGKAVPSNAPVVVPDVPATIPVVAPAAPETAPRDAQAAPASERAENAENNTAAAEQRVALAP